MDIQKIKELALANGFSLKEQASGNIDLHSYVYEFAQAIENEVLAQARSVFDQEGFVLAPKEPTQQIYRTFYDAFNSANAGNTAQCFKIAYKAVISAFEEDAELNAIADSRAGQKRISVNIEDL